MTGQQKQEEPTFEEQLRDLLRESIVVIEKLLPYCKTADDLVAMLKLAVDNDGQLNLLKQQLMPLNKR